MARVKKGEGRGVGDHRGRGKLQGLLWVGRIETGSKSGKIMVDGGNKKRKEGEQLTYLGGLCSKKKTKTMPFF